MADAVKASALVVDTAVPGLAAMTMDVGKAPCTEVSPMIQPGPQWKTSETKLN